MVAESPVVPKARAAGSSRSANGSERASALDGFAREAQPEALDQAGNAFRVHLEPVMGRELAERLRLGLGCAAHVHELCEEPLEAGWGDDLQDPGRLLTGVPEGVPLVAG